MNERACVFNVGTRMFKKVTSSDDFGKKKKNSTGAEESANRLRWSCCEPTERRSVGHTRMDGLGWVLKQGPPS